MSKITISDLVIPQEYESLVANLNDLNEQELAAVMGGLGCRAACANGCGTISL
jgi:hypothetical protein